MKRLAILVLLLAIFSLVFLAGCIETKATFTFHNDGTYDSKVVFKTDKIMGGDELTFLGWQIEYIFPFLMTEYEHTVQTTKADYSEYLEHIFKANGLDIETFNTRPNSQFCRVCTIISGPMPLGSPKVIAITGNLEFITHSEQQ
jgi:hypothetical protein